MKVVLLHKEEINAKGGKVFVKYGGFNAQGKIIEIFVTKEQADAFGIPDSKLVTPQELKEMHSNFETVDVQFNERGRVDSVEV